MKVFEITVRGRDGESWPVVAQATAPGSLLPIRESGRLVLDLGELARCRSAAGYGEVLGRALFTGGVGRLFAEAAGGAGDVRVLLSIEDADLKALHWQRLCGPRRRGIWSHLALDQRTPLSLYLPSASDRRFPPIGRRDLTALAVVASPAGLERWKLEPLEDEAVAVADVRRALGEIPCDVLARAGDAAGPPTLPEIRRRLTGERYTLLHVVAHGRFVPGERGEPGETFLYLEHPEPTDPENRVQAVSSRQLVEELGQHGARGLPYLAFFATCESAAPDAEGALAQRLVADLGLPAVVAMTGEVTTETTGALTSAFYGRLREHGEADRALAEAAAGLAGRYDVTVPALYTRLSGQPIFSDDLDRELNDEDVRRGLADLEELVAARAPVLLPELRRSRSALEGCLGVDPEELEPEARARREEALREVGNLAEEVLEMSFHALALGRRPPEDPAKDCPFRGAEPFGSEHAADFHGRDALVDEAVARLRRDRFLALVGPSGGGKTSVALAGLVPALRRLEPDLEVVHFAPGPRAAEELETIVAQAAGRPSLLVVDPLEDVLRQAPEEASRFLARLGELPEARAAHRVVVVLGEAFLGRLRDLSGGGLGDGLEVAPLAKEELREAGERQARQRAGLRFEAGLLDLVLDDLGAEPGAMTAVQAVLAELWERRHGSWLRLGEYQALRSGPGGLAGPLAERAEEVWRRASDLERPLLRHLFLRLVKPDEDERPGRPRDTCRKTELARLVPAGEPEAAVRRLAARLARARLLVLRSPRGAPEEVELASEKLLAGWPRLAKWTEEDRPLLRLRDEIGEAAERWRLSPDDRKPSRLVHRGPPLRDVEDRIREGRLGLDATERAYVEACRRQEEELRERELEAARRLAEESVARRRAEEERARHAEELLHAERRAAARLRRRAVALGILAAVAAVLAWSAWRSANQASAARRVGLARQLAAQSLARRDTRLDQSLLLAVEAAGVLRDAEPASDGGRAIDSEARQSLLASLTHHPALDFYLHRYASPVAAFAGGAGGDLLAASAGDASVLVWRAGDRAPFARLGEPENHDPEAGHTDRVEDVAFRPDGRRLASAGADRSVLVWDLESPPSAGPVLRLTGHRDEVAGVAWSPDGGALASASLDGTVGLWDAATGELLRYLEKDAEGELVTVAWSGDGRTLAAGGRGPRIFLWNADTGEPRGLLPLTYNQRVLDLAWSPWDRGGQSDPGGGILAVGGDALAVTLFDMGRGGEVLATLSGHRNSARTVAWSDDGRTLASGGGDSMIVLWTRTEASEAFEATRFLPGHDSRLTGLAWSRDRLTSAAADGALIRWRTGAEHAGAVGGLLACQGEYAAYRLAGSGDGRLLALVSLGSPEVLVCDAGSGEAVHRLPGHEAGSVTAAFSPDGARLASGGFDGRVRLWDPVSGEAGPAFDAHGDWVISLAWSPDGGVLASGARDGKVRLWDPRTGEATRDLESHEDTVTALAWSPDGGVLASAGGDDRIVVWDAGTGEPRRRLDPGSGFGIWSLAWSPDGRILASGGGDTRVLLWDAGSGERLGEPLSGSTSLVHSLAFSPDGRTLAGLSMDVAVFLWDVASHRLLGRLAGPERSLASGDAVWSPDGRSLFAAAKFVVSDEEGYSRIVWFSVDEAEWRRRACRRANRRLTEEEWRSFVGPDGPWEPACGELALN